jgi:hypothetical protein
MTALEFANYKLQIQYIISQKAEAICNYLAIGKGNLSNDKVNLELLITYMDIMNTYDLESDSTSSDTTVNFFYHEDMQDIVTHINKICGTHYNVDLITE